VRAGRRPSEYQAFTDNGTGPTHRAPSRGLSGVRVLWASGDENETDLAHGVISQLLPDLLASEPGAGLAALRPDTDPPEVGADLLSELGTLQTSGPVLVVIDDAQWADHRSALVLIFVARRLRSDQVMILLSSRSGAPDPRQLWERALAQSQLTRRLPLGGLTGRICGGCPRASTAYSSREQRAAGCTSTPVVTPCTRGHCWRSSPSRP
jgi:hypothetical protein